MNLSWAVRVLKILMDLIQLGAINFLMGYTLRKGAGFTLVFPKCYHLLAWQSCKELNGPSLTLPVAGTPGDLSSRRVRVDAQN